MFKKKESKLTQEKIMERIRDDQAEEIWKGLNSPHKKISSKYFYDKRGSALFEKIGELDEYYPTRTEISILENSVEDIRSKIDPSSILYELGSGSSIKTRILLSNIDRILGYVPIDICAEALEAAEERLKQSFPQLQISPICVDFCDQFELSDKITQSHPLAQKVVFFPGSTIGNFHPLEAMALLKNLKIIVGSGGKFLIGVDRLKDPSILEKAYNDSQGVTENFNLNILHHLNREFSTDFDVSLFRHSAYFNSDLCRIEMHLVCTQNCSVHFRGNVLQFQSGESIHTENSYKYEKRKFISLAEASGLHFLKCWSDPREYFSVYLFET